MWHRIEKCWWSLRCRGKTDKRTKIAEMIQTCTRAHVYKQSISFSIHRARLWGANAVRPRCKRDKNVEWKTKKKIVDQLCVDWTLWAVKEVVRTVARAAMKVLMAVVCIETKQIQQIYCIRQKKKANNQKQPKRTDRPSQTHSEDRRVR